MAFMLSSKGIKNRQGLELLSGWITLEVFLI